MNERDVLLNELAQGLRPTHTPAVLISRGRIDEQLGIWWHRLSVA
ncbi:hypothetical protein ACWD26_37835 [Streptomyces sp. NPDC002787]